MSLPGKMSTVVVDKFTLLC